MNSENGSESDPQGTAAPVEVLRTTSSSVLFFTIGAICVLGVASIVVGDLTLRGLAVAGMPIAVFMIVFALYRFPRVELRHRELALINPLKSVVVPWNLVDGFDTHFGLAVRTPEGTYSSWPLAGRGKKMERDSHSIRRLVDNPNPAVEAVLERHRGLSEDELANPGGVRRVSVEWNVRLIAAVLGALAWAAIGFAALPS